MHDVMAGLAAWATGRGEAGDWSVIPVTSIFDVMAEARGRFTLMTVLPSFRGEIYHLG